MINVVFWKLLYFGIYILYKWSLCFDQINAESVVTFCTSNISESHNYATPKVKWNQYNGRNHTLLALASLTSMFVALPSEPCETLNDSIVIFYRNNRTSIQWTPGTKSSQRFCHTIFGQKFQKKNKLCIIYV